MHQPPTQGGCSFNLREEIDSASRFSSADPAIPSHLHFSITTLLSLIKFLELSDHLRGFQSHLQLLIISNQTLFGKQPHSSGNLQRLSFLSLYSFKEMVKFPSQTYLA